MIDWFSTAQGIAVVGVVTFLALLLAIWGIVRQAGHTKGNREGIEHATRVLRTSELRTAVGSTQQLAGRIVRLDLSKPKAGALMRDLGQSWLESQQRVFGLVRDLGGLDEVEDFRKAMRAAKMEVRVAIRESREARRWTLYRFDFLVNKLNTYGEAAESMLRAADDEVLGGQSGH